MTDAVNFFNDAAEFSKRLDTQAQTNWLAQYRQPFYNEMNTHSWPTRKTESFKYNNVNALLQKRVLQSTLSYETDHNDLRLKEDQMSTSLLSLSEQLNADTLFLLNGVLQTKLSTSINEAVLFSEANEEQQQRILSLLPSQFQSQHLLALLNSGLLEDGIFLDITESRDRPIHIVHCFDGSKAQGENEHASTLVFRHLVRTAKHVKATVIEHYVSLSENAASVHVNQQTDIHVGDNSQLELYRLHLENEKNIHFGQMNAWLNRDAIFESFHLGLGSDFKRIDVTINHEASGSHCEMQGVYLGQNRQQIDYHTTIEHKVPNCTTNEVFRGILDDHSKGVFNGRIHIHPDAQKTLAELSNKNLLLSNNAEINTKPELEIYADDVKCAHGATVSQMDSTALFYLQSRGIPKAQAEVMLSFGFINELIDNIKLKPIGDYLRPIISELFGRVDILEQAENSFEDQRGE